MTRRLTDTGKLIITNQFRKRLGMVYDFRCDDDRLTLTVTPRANASDPADWHLEASSKADPPFIVEQWGATRAEALQQIGGAWRSGRVASHAPMFDWEAIAAALTAVRAL